MLSFQILIETDDILLGLVLQKSFLSLVLPYAQDFIDVFALIVISGLI